MVAASVGILQEVLSDTARSTDCPGIDFAVFHGTALLVVEGDGAGMYHPEVLGPRMATATGYTEITTQECVRHPLGLVRLGAACCSRRAGVAVLSEASFPNRCGGCLALLGCCAELDAFLEGTASDKCIDPVCTVATARGQLVVVPASDATRSRRLSAGVARRTVV